MLDFVSLPTPNHFVSDALISQDGDYRHAPALILPQEVADPLPPERFPTPPTVTPRVEPKIEMIVIESDHEFVTRRTLLQRLA